MTTRREVLHELKARLLGIAKDDGFNTDLGSVVFLAEEPQLGPDDPDQAIAIVVNRDEITYQGVNIATRLPVTIAALAKRTNDDPFQTIEDALEDIKRAVERDPDSGEPDHNFGGLLVHRGLERGSTAPVDRKDGSEFVGLGIDYTLVFNERWAAP